LENAKSFSERFLKQFVCPSINPRSRNGDRMFFDSSMPCSKKWFRRAGIGIGKFPEKASQFLMPDSQRRFSAIAPMPWIWMNVLVKMPILFLFFAV
jgi:hypothetical protein